MKQILIVMGTAALTAVCTSLATVKLVNTNQGNYALETGLDETYGPRARFASFGGGKVNQSPFGGDDFHPNGGGPCDFSKAAAEATPSVVHIKCKQGQQKNNRYDFFFFDAQGGGESSGSGVIVTEDGYILTNNHVVENAQELKVTLNNKRTYTAKLIGTDPSTDLALIKIEDLDGEKLQPMQFANSDQLLIGDWVLAVGNPFNLTSTVTAGIVSAKGRNIDILEGQFAIESFIQTDAAVNPGNSGGALVNSDGKLVGINTAIITKSGRYEGYSFAIPVNLASKVMKDLKEFGKVQRGFLGVMIQDVSPEIAKDKGLNSLDGVYLDRVNREGAAEKGGLQAGDVIIGVDGKKIRSRNELQERVAAFRPGDKVDMEYIRNGKTEKTTITLLPAAAASAPASAQRNTSPTAGGMTKEKLENRLGGTLRALTPAEEKRLKTKGVIVERIKPGSLLEKTNMAENFVITRCNDERVTDVEELLASIRAGGTRATFDGFYEEYRDQGQFSYVCEL